VVPVLDALSAEPPEPVGTPQRRSTARTPPAAAAGMSHHNSDTRELMRMVDAAAAQGLCTSEAAGVLRAGE
jgi:hypothetical protein